jgi:Mn2+/Fe2+ NRAMP family transporter
MKRNFWKVLGPGIIWAGAAVGVSHLVQSTRAGASFGFDLIVLVLLVNLLKYPFFEFGPRYAAVSGESLIHGYHRMGKWAVTLFFVMTLGTMFTMQAAVTSVTIGIFSSLFPGLLSFQEWTILIFGICLLVVAVGRYKALDHLMKVFMLILALSTVVAVIAAFTRGFHPDPAYAESFTWNPLNVAFLIAIAGWMPSAIDISVWNSMWTLEKIKQTGYRPTRKEILLDFNIGYIGTTFLALCFLTLGALSMYGSGIDFSENGSVFAMQLFELYTSSIGKWTHVIIAIAASATMFSTTLTVIDAYPRVLVPVTKILIPSIQKTRAVRYLNYFWWLLLLVIAFLVMTSFSSKIKLLVDIATSLSFITAPVLGYLNYKAVTSDHIALADQPKTGLRILSWIGLVVLSAFAVYFIVLRIF